ncbi:helix-turn-helix domain-containing protein [Streptomyces sp. NRRL S-87]|uniref:helix-turn-helix domain-containing protein n=1 Tax=Streptomyces sp. NRRL S-87 TaxID=1463920 RepID=UPI000689BE3C|nr:helix-turn-helix domain-containing protein [Streptomyces sp. NRRL S-87]
MSDPWVALPSGADPAERTRALRRAHAAFAADGRVVPSVRAVVAESWRRSARARVSPECAPRVELPDRDLADYRAAHPLARVMPVVRELVGTVAADGEHLLAVCDAGGRLLWVEGHGGTRRRAEALGFVPGARWAESVMGTNAPGTATALDRPVQVFGAEHFSRRVHPWTCAAAPLHDPHSGRLLGAVDITGGDGLAHPHSLAFVQAVARAAEAQLALLPAEAVPGAAGTSLGAASVGVLRVLGRDEAEWRPGAAAGDGGGGGGAGGRTGAGLRLSRRHSEIMLLLARHPQGLGGDELLVALYEDEDVSPVTLRAELSRLRALLGPDTLLSRPYRLAGAVETDYGWVAERLALGAVSAAVRGYPGPLLPGSAAPEITRLRRRLADELRAALIARGDAGLLGEWAYSPWGEDDPEVWRALARTLPAERRAPALARVRTLDADLGLAGVPHRPPGRLDARRVPSSP